ncbi:hypothetical protein JCM31826_08950 [Thermaurantimonas aggregans]|uniref:Uncharacterized protein n=1 Tax=Thermaurantimonas aggregans TaxID=2173829 RepID=A0A401XK97_9FLAO|nr:hypothetical protein [Thermaurantimonas aggregans]MCX8148510.1 hypothetical protein [Thermaurantimonas aggregans]GCD77413.1 hypothetical protein JCM31826_08950 [Thermaurantimonas aggregans]
MQSVDTKIFRIAIILTFLSLLPTCKISNTSAAPTTTAFSALLQVVHPFNEDDHLASVKILKIKECYLPKNCAHITIGKEELASFEFTHKNTSNNLKFRALREHFSGVKSGDIINAYIIAERQKHGNTLIKIYEYSVIDNSKQKSIKR